MHRFISFFVIIAGMAGAIISEGTGTINAKYSNAYILIEAETKSVIEEHYSDLKLNSGYLTKLMSILLISESIAEGEMTLSDELTASESVRNTKGSVIWLECGDKITVEELLKSVIIGNANDALTVLAEKVSGNVGSFVMDMNAKAFDLGMRSTQYISPYGYYNENEYTSAHDVALVCAELTKYDFLTPYFSRMPSNSSGIK